MCGRFFILLFCLFSSLVYATPDIQTWETNKGAKVFLVESHELPMVDIKLIFDAGSSRDESHPGLAVLTNDLLSEGAAGKSVDDISNVFESLGAIYGSDAGYDSASIGLRSLSDGSKLEPALENLIDVLTKPDFPEAAFQREKNRMMIGLRSKKQSPAALARDAFYEALYDKHPYARPSEGTEESLSAITVDDLRDFHKQNYLANNVIVAMVGDVSRDQAEKIAEQLTQQLAVGEKQKAIPEVSDLKKAETIYIEHPSGQMHVLMGQPGVKRGDADYFPLYVGNHVLGGGGMVSRLFKEIREKRGLSYSAYSYFNPMREAGPFLSGLQTRADQTEEAIAVLKDNLKRFIEQGPTEEELVASKKNITGGFPLRLDSNGKILGYLSVIGFYGLPLDYLETFNAKIEAVTVDQIKDAFRKHLNPDKFVTVKVGPKLEEDLNKDPKENKDS